jgi:thioredoxin reductase (NADPH)
LEQDSLGGTIAHYPRGKLVMTAPGKLPIVGKVPFKETTKEELLQFLMGAEQKSELKINYGERVESIARNGNGFEVRSARETYQTHAVLLAIGRRGTPRKLGVQGEEQEKVVYRMIDPEQYRGRNVLVVGGGDSALEAAMSIAEQPGTNVSISYRSGGFSRAKPKNRQKMQQIESEGQLRLLLKSNVRSIDAERVVLEQEGREVELDNDAVIVCAGGILPTPFLREIGIEVETKHGGS